MHTFIRLGFLTVAILLLGSMHLASQSVSAQTFGSNLIVNSGAEDGTGSTDGSVVAVPGWTVTGNFTAVKYETTSSSFPGLDSPGPQNRGVNFFAGGPSNSASSGSQLIDVTGQSANIDAGNVSYNLTGYFGGFASQDDNAVLKVIFLNAGNAAIGGGVIGPVLAAERNNITGMLLRAGTGPLPAGTRTVMVTLQFTRTAGSYNDGYADNLSFTLANAPASCTQPPSGMVAWFPAEGNANDIQGGNNGTIQGDDGASDVKFSTGKVGQAFDFDGTNDYVSAPDSPTFRQTNFTVEGWYKLSAAQGGGTQGHIVAKAFGTSFQDSYVIWFQDGTLHAYVVTNSGSLELFSGFGADIGVWHHVALTYDAAAASLKFYVDGALLASGSLGGQVAYDAHPFQIGADIQNETVQFFFPGQIDEIALFSRALSQAEIQSIFNSGGAGKCAPGVVSAGNVLISEFRFRGPAGTGDEFVELFNNTNATINVTVSDASGGWALATSDNVIRAIVPIGTNIPARGHFLLGCGCTYFSPDLNFVGGDVPDNSSLAIFKSANPANFNTTLLDAVGFTGAPSQYFEGTPLAPISATNEEHSFVRKVSSVTGFTQDTGNNAQDFVLISTSGTVGGNNVVLGAPGPENLSSPVLKDRPQFPGSLIEPTASQAADPNRVLAGSGASRTLSIRRRFTNMTGQTITRLRFRVIDITTLHSPVVAPPQAELRLISSSDAMLATPTTLGVSSVQGTTLETPSQPNGGGLNSSVTVALPGGGLSSTSGGVCASGQQCTVDLQFLLSIVQGGRFNIFFNIEAQP